jgi:hypothetical protein
MQFLHSAYPSATRGSRAQRKVPQPQGDTQAFDAGLSREEL